MTIKDYSGYRRVAKLYPPVITEEIILCKHITKHVESISKGAIIKLPTPLKPAVHLENVHRTKFSTDLF